jgi:hypothetical protein
MLIRAYNQTLGPESANDVRSGLCVVGSGNSTKQEHLDLLKLKRDSKVEGVP